jgi:hypothetical protein
LSGGPWSEEVGPDGFPTPKTQTPPASPVDPLGGASWLKSIGAVVDTMTRLGGFGTIPKMAADLTGMSPGTAVNAGADSYTATQDFINGGWQAWVWYIVFGLALIALVFFGTMNLVRA